jgi:hypothetical protein
LPLSRTSAFGLHALLERIYFAQRDTTGTKANALHPSASAKIRKKKIKVMRKTNSFFMKEKLKEKFI